MSTMPDKKLELYLKRYKCKELAGGNILTPPARLSYPKLFKPEANKNNANAKPSYSTSLLFPKGADLGALQEACESTAVEHFGSKWKQKKIRMPLRDQGSQTYIDENDDEQVKTGYTPGAMFCNANSYRKPGLVMRDGQTPIDEDDGILYAGCWVIASVRPGAYDTDGNSGVKIWLQNVMFLDDDDKLGGGGSTRPADDFGALQSPDDIDAMFDGDDDDFA